MTSSTALSEEGHVMHVLPGCFAKLSRLGSTWTLRAAIGASQRAVLNLGLCLSISRPAIWTKFEDGQRRVHKQEWEMGSFSHPCLAFTWTWRNRTCERRMLLRSQGVAPAPRCFTAKLTLSESSSDYRVHSSFSNPSRPTTLLRTDLCFSRAAPAVLFSE